MRSKKLIRKDSLAKENYLVAVKILLRDGDKLLITHDIFGQWDIPGGRIRKDQFETPMEDILDGKIKQELGNKVQYELGPIVETIRVEREEHGRNGEIVRIFAVCYEAKYLGGEIEIGDIHDEYRWVDITTADLSEFKTDSGWVHQLENYQAKISS